MMRHFANVCVVAAQLCVWGVAATSYGSYDWVDKLPDCWEKCLDKTDSGCHSQKCICAASQDVDYLTTAVECARDKCDSNSLDISARLIGAAAIYCAVVDNKIPDDVTSSALACAMGVSLSTTSQPAAATTTTKKQSEGSFKSTTTSTLTQTSTDSDGNTLQIVVPIVMGPSTFSTGSATTSTVEPSSTSPSASSTSISASPSQTVQITSPTSLQAASSSSTAPPTTTQRGSNSGGSPFENMQAAASQYGFSGPAVALGLIAGVFMRL